MNWHAPVAQAYNLIRGTNPAPGAWTTYKGAKLGIFDAARVPGDGISGRIRAVTEDGVEVQSIGGRILVKRVRPDGGGKMSASEWAAEVGLAVGDEFDS